MTDEYDMPGCSPTPDVNMDAHTLTPAEQAELDRRLETLDQDRAEGTPWEDLKAELEQALPVAPQVVFAPLARRELIEANPGVCCALALKQRRAQLGG